MPTLEIALPDLKEADFGNKRELRALRDYMYRLSEQLNYTLSHLDMDNMSEGLAAMIKTGGDRGELSTAIEQNSQAIALKASRAALDSLEERVAGAEASIELNADGISGKVSKGSVVSEINQSAEQVKISAAKIALEGVVTANDGFRINEDGSMRATAGSLGAFSADAQGNLAGAASLQVGGVTLSGSYASGLKIRPENLEYATNVPSGSSGVYFLALTDTGHMVLVDLYISNGQLQVSPPGSAPSQGGSANVILISAAGNGLKKRQYASTSSASLGSCVTGERYGISNTQTDQSGYLWTQCGTKYGFDSSTGKYQASPINAFWVRKTSNDGTVSYYDNTTVNTY